MFKHIVGKKLAIAFSAYTSSYQTFANRLTNKEKYNEYRNKISDHIRTCTHMHIQTYMHSVEHIYTYKSTWHLKRQSSKQLNEWLLTLFIFYNIIIIIITFGLKFTYSHIIDRLTRVYNNMHTSNFQEVMLRILIIMTLNNDVY